MTATEVMETLRDNAVPIDLDAPGEYLNQINLAAMLGTFLLSMPLEEMSRRAEEARNQALLDFSNSGASWKEVRRTQQLVDILLNAKREIVKMQARYGA